MIPAYTTEERLTFYDTDRKERAYYKTFNSKSLEKSVNLPVTRDGFEALLELLCSFKNIPVDDFTRQVLAGYVHHVERDQDSAPLKTLVKVLNKSVSINLTYVIDQEIKEKKIKQQREEAEKAKSDNVVNINSGADVQG